MMGARHDTFLKLIDALDDCEASGETFGLLTHAEQELLHALRVRLRTRRGEYAYTPARARDATSRAIAALRAEDGEAQ